MTDVDEDEDRARRLGWARGDAKRKLVERGWEPEEAKATVDAIPDELYAIIQAFAVEEVTDCWTAGMRATIRMRELRDWIRDLWPPDTERSINAKRRRMAALESFLRARA
ncbi:hypothetical protein [Microbacterium trichothecenolyticum]|uniref:Uncharacterized protein n=1 Tax=Microbacterium trichothecenolyticum TaxID=69370 RepID=A0A0M2HFX2_MICTR|nr:hypothetical protein [Microbacterium trichothecenolyticum]KJL45577.1 hypothetical protein RS82_00129 [Microbacterium trichothecenolyticum]